MTTHHQGEIYDTIRIECWATPEEVRAYLGKNQDSNDRHLYYCCRCTLCDATCVVRSDHLNIKICLCQKARHRRQRQDNTSGPIED